MRGPMGVNRVAALSNPARAALSIVARPGVGFFLPRIPPHEVGAGPQLRFSRGPVRGLLAIQKRVAVLRQLHDPAAFFLPYSHCRPGRSLRPGTRYPTHPHTCHTLLRTRLRPAVLSNCEPHLDGTRELRLQRTPGRDPEQSTEPRTHAHSFAYTASVSARGPLRL